MGFSYQRTYRGPIQAVVMDWAGTTVDYGSRAPALVFVEAFQRHDIEITLQEARGPMGMSKNDHIRELMRLPRVQELWRTVHDREPSEDDIASIYAQFTTLQTSVIADYAELIPGTLDAMAFFRRRGIMTGSCTGYTRAMMDVLVPAAAALGFEPDCVVAGDETPAGRPAPWMALQNAMQLGFYPMEAVVKIGDTIADIEEGLNAGMWTIGISMTGNEVGLSKEEVALLPQDELDALIQGAEDRLYRAGAHIVVDGIGDVPAAIERIEDRIQQL